MRTLTRKEFDSKYHYDTARACINCDFFYENTNPHTEVNSDICEKRTDGKNTTLFMCVCDLFQPIDYKNPDRRFQKYQEIFPQEDEE